MALLSAVHQQPHASLSLSLSLGENVEKIPSFKLYGGYFLFNHVEFW